MAGTPSLSLLQAIKTIVPNLCLTTHKGQSGKIGVIGGCREYTGAPYFSAISALKIGADLSHVFCSKEASTVIKSYSPELIVHPVLLESWEPHIGSGKKEEIIRQVVENVTKWLPRINCLVIGPGLGRDALLLECVTIIIGHAKSLNIPLVIDGDGLFLATNDTSLIHGYRRAILTPNVNEYNRLCATLQSSESDNTPLDVKNMSQLLGGVTVMQKGSTDRISDGETELQSHGFGSPRRCGGQGDILAGGTAVFMAWACNAQKSSTEKDKFLTEFGGNPAMAAAYAGSLVLRMSASPAYEKYKRSMLATNIIDELGRCVESLFPAGGLS